MLKTSGIAIVLVFLQATVVAIKDDPEIPTECFLPDNKCTFAHEQKHILIGIGCQKCGSTSLFAALKGLDDLYLYKEKELHYFDRHFNASEDEKTLFSEYFSAWKQFRREEPWVPSELSPVYMVDKYVPYRMMHIFKRQWESVRFIAILRDPVERAYSGFFQSSVGMTYKQFPHQMRIDMEAVSKCYLDALFVNENNCLSPKEMYANAEKCRKEKIGDGNPWFDTPSELPESMKLYESVLYRGIYVDQLRNYLCAGWKPEQFLIISTNEMKTNLQGVINRVVKHTGITNRLQGYAGKRIENNKTPHVGSKTASKPAMPKDIEHELARFYTPYNEQLIHFLKKHNFNTKVIEMEIELMGMHDRHPRHAKKT
eukprot:m.7777 g.7777  ORF g.7777 m.7777 type:complete len:370 (-) comp2916_c0_seq1:74-1183(-)